MRELSQALATNLRQLRETHGLSLAQLGEQSGVGKATLFKIEAGRTNPTLDTLSAIADAFDLSVPELLREPEQVMVVHLAAGEGEPISDSAAQGFVLRRQVIGAGSIEIHAKTFREGVAMESMSHGAGVREHVFVRSGSILLGPDGGQVLVAAGGYATYPADQRHRWEAKGGDAELWIVHTFPRTSAFGEVD